MTHPNGWGNFGFWVAYTPHMMQNIKTLGGRVLIVQNIDIQMFEPCSDFTKDHQENRDIDTYKYFVILIF